MKRHNYFPGSFLVLISTLLLSAASIYAAEESVTVTTYYPSPYGVYGEMRLYPKASPTACQEGLMFYSNGSNPLYSQRGIYVCGASGWKSMGGGKYDGIKWISFTRLDAFHNPVGTSFVAPVPDDWTTATIQGWAQGLAQSFHWKVDWIHAQATGQSATGPTWNVLAEADYTDPSAKYPVEWLSDSTGSSAWNTNPGNIGIGTTNPQAKLHIIGADDHDGIMVRGGIGVSRIGDTKVSVGLGADQGGVLELGALGPSVDPRWFSINPVSGGTPYIDLHYGNGLAEDYNTRIINIANNALAFYTHSNGEVMRISGGNVGIRMSTPWATLDIAGSPVNIPGFRTLNSGANSRYIFMVPELGAGGYNWLSQNGDSGIFFSNLGAGLVIGPWVGSSSGMRMTSSGFVGIGVTSPGYQLQLSLDSAGKPNGGSWSNSSDERLKTNINPIIGALEKITSLKGVNFEWKNPEEHSAKTNEIRAGFLAQEVEKIFPQFISEIDASGKDKELTADGKIKSLALPFDFDAYLVEAIKEQQGQIEELKAEVGSLKAELGELKTKR